MQFAIKKRKQKKLLPQFFYGCFRLIDFLIKQLPTLRDRIEKKRPTEKRGKCRERTEPESSEKGFKEEKNLVDFAR
jgi:hypothetical protein